MHGVRRVMRTGLFTVSRFMSHFFGLSVWLKSASFTKDDCSQSVITATARSRGFRDWAGQATAENAIRGWAIDQSIDLKSSRMKEADTTISLHYCETYPLCESHY